MRQYRLKRIITATVIMALLFSAAHITAFAVTNST